MATKTTVTTKGSKTRRSTVTRRAPSKATLKRAIPAKNQAKGYRGTTTIKMRTSRAAPRGGKIATRSGGGGG